MTAVRAFRVARMVGTVLFGATMFQCKNDYERFDLSGKRGSRTGGSSGGGSAGSGAGGSAGSRGGAAGIGGAPADGSAGTPADGSSCGTGQKLCAGRCVLISDPRFGCEAPSCEPC